MLEEEEGRGGEKEVRGWGERYKKKEEELVFWEGRGE